MLNIIQNHSFLLYFLLINSFRFISSIKWFLASSIFFILHSWLCFLQTWLYIFWYLSILIMKPRISYLNWSFLFKYFDIFMTTLTVSNRKTSCFLKNLVSLYFLYVLQTLQYTLNCLDSIEYILILFCHLFYIH